jgi:NAD(P)-dependent dehydrogenase (short-subunit alcohol dehydrogenase family)
MIILIRSTAMKMSQNFKSINKLSGSCVVIFGGTSGIGLAVAAAALEHGASIFVPSSKKERVEGAVTQLKPSYLGDEFRHRIAGVACDLSEPDTLEQNLVLLFETVTHNALTGEKKLTDHIVFTAGNILRLVPIIDSIAISILNSAIIRFVAPLIIGKLATQYMCISNRSSITATGGSMTRRPEKHWSILAAYASGTEGMRFGLAKDLAPIRVNAVSPGSVQTPLLQRLPEEEKARWRSQLLTQEMGWPEDVAEAYIYSMKDRSATGALADSSDGRLFS